MTTANIVSYLRTKYNPKTILRHGSRARGDGFDKSDYDLDLIAEHPEQIRPEFYQGCALNIGGIEPTETVLKAGKTSIWSCLVR